MKFALLNILIFVFTSCRTHYKGTNPSFAELTKKQSEFYNDNSIDTFLLYRETLKYSGEAKFTSIKNGTESCQILRKEPTKRKTKSTFPTNCNLPAIIEYFKNNDLNGAPPIVATSYMSHDSYMFIDFKLGNMNYSDSIEGSALWNSIDTLNPRYKLFKLVVKGL